jgi:hypothetical protein
METPSLERVAGEPGRVDYTDRLRVSGGWLYRTRVHEGVALVFVPRAGRAAATPGSQQRRPLRATASRSGGEASEKETAEQQH